MDRAKLKSWWLSLGLSEAEADSELGALGVEDPDEGDFADMGTAFGLDAAFGPPSQIMDGDFGLGAHGVLGA